MGNNKLGMITDIHFGCRGSNLHFQYYMEKFLVDFFEGLSNHNVKELLCLGDFTDSRKATNYQIIDRVNQCFFSEIKNLGIDLSIICGNHDSFYRNTLKVNSINSLFNSGNVNIIDTPTEMNYGLVIPWINEDNTDQVMQAIKNSKSKYLYGHLSIADAKMYKNSRAEHGLDANIFKQFTSVFSGHFHHRSQYGNIQYIGAAGYYTWQDYNDNRGWTLFDYDEGVQYFIENEHCIFHRIIYNDEDGSIPSETVNQLKGKMVQLVVQHKENEDQFDTYIKAMNEIDMIDFKVIDETIFKVARKEDQVAIEARDMLELINEYVDEQDDEDLNTSSIKELAKETYEKVLV